MKGREKCQDLGNLYKNNQDNNAFSTRHTSDGRSQKHKQKGYLLVGGEADKENIHLETNELTCEEGDFQKNQDNIEEVVKVLTNEEKMHIAAKVACRNLGV
ncbi:hypothetical protein RhiirC2_798018 [Rhizophagus irregularis]|uniref:Uncharacterized protein n=1 Tax=Rhizophagus irregularis TaxID=588596 RepID=A0A2N1M728_9GLOM|nr:hypothetical protein RhiirC2_798018 [Rhizophagus irregularis]